MEDIWLRDTRSSGCGNDCFLCVVVNGFASAARAYRRGFSGHARRSKRLAILYLLFPIFTWLFGVVQWRFASGFLWVVHNFHESRIRNWTSVYMVGLSCPY
jgi:hypothetical protein